MKNDNILSFCRHLSLMARKGMGRDLTICFLNRIFLDITKKMSYFNKDPTLLQKSSLFFAGVTHVKFVPLIFFQCLFRVFPSFLIQESTCYLLFAHVITELPFFFTNLS